LLIILELEKTVNCEGVMVYLDRQAVEITLRKITSTAEGSVVAFDYLNRAPRVAGALLALREVRDPGRRRTVDVQDR
jgi:O-methyltransferase involved in polyketide biosynthesis